MRWIPAPIRLSAVLCAALLVCSSVADAQTPDDTAPQDTTAPAEPAGAPAESPVSVAEEHPDFLAARLLVRPRTVFHVNTNSNTAQARNTFDVFYGEGMRPIRMGEFTTLIGQPDRYDDFVRRRRNLHIGWGVATGALAAGTLVTGLAATRDHDPDDLSRVVVATSVGSALMMSGVMWGFTVLRNGLPARWYREDQARRHTDTYNRRLLESLR